MSKLFRIIDNKQCLWIHAENAEQAKTLANDIIKVSNKTQIIDQTDEYHKSALHGDSLKLLLESNVYGQVVWCIPSYSVHEIMKKVKTEKEKPHWACNGIHF